MGNYTFVAAWGTGITKELRPILVLNQQTAFDINKLLNTVHYLAAMLLPWVLSVAKTSETWEQEKFNCA